MMRHSRGLVAFLVAVGAFASPAFSQYATSEPSLFDQADLNRDQKVTTEEVNQVVAREFAKYDLNRDGIVVFQDIVAVAGTPIFNTGRMTKEQQEQYLQSLRSVFSAYDANRDERLTLEEYTGFILKLRDSFDTNKDGIVTRAEYEAQVKQAQAAAQQPTKR